MAPLGYQSERVYESSDLLLVKALYGDIMIDIGRLNKYSQQRLFVAGIYNESVVTEPHHGQEATTEV